MLKVNAAWRLWGGAQGLPSGPVTSPIPKDVRTSQAPPILAFFLRLQWLCGLGVWSGAL